MVLKLFETISLDKLGYIVDHFDKFRGSIRDSCFEDNDYNPLSRARNILNSCDKKGKLEVVYYQKRNFGRYWAENGVSMQGLIREIRHTIANGLYVDIDMKNAHPVILSYLCHKNDFDCKYLDKYIADRDKYLKRYDSREKGKKLYLSLTNGGTSDFDKLENPDKDLVKYRNEMLKLHESFAELYEKDFKKYSKRKEKEGKQYNHKAGFMNSLLCDMENKILMVMFDYLGDSNEAVLCFDGIMLPVREKGYNMAKCEKRIEKKFPGLKMKLDIKPFNEGLKLPEVIPKYISKKDRNGLIFDNDKIEPNRKQLKILEKICNDIFENFETDEVLNIVLFAVKNYSKCKAVFEIVKKVVGKAYSKKLKKLWNIENCSKKQITLGSLIYIHKKIKKESKEWGKKYSLLKLECHIDQLDSVDKIDLKHVIFNNSHVTKSIDDHSPFMIDDIKKCKNKIIMIKSHTGSGKTALLKWIANKFPEHTFISTAERIILNQSHSEFFGTEKCHTNHIKKKPIYWKRNGDTNGMSCVLDSLIHIKLFRKEKYILFLDETSSLLAYLLSDKSNMKTIRRRILYILIYLILTAEYVFCVDADLNTPTVKFIYDMAQQYKNDNFKLDDSYFCDEDDDDEDIPVGEESDSDFDINDFFRNGIKEKQHNFIKKEIVLFENKFLKKRCSVMEYYDMNRIMFKMIQDLEEGRTVFICSDSNKKFHDKVFMKIVSYLEIKICLIKKKKRTKLQEKILKKIKNGQFKYYSADEGDKSDFTKKIKKLKNCVIFCTPAITTGIDLNFKAEVYGIYYGNHLHANTIVQQLCRIRRPQHINLYFSHLSYKYEYCDFQKLVEDKKIVHEQFRSFFKNINTNTIDEIEMNFKNHIDFIFEKLRSIRYHTLDILAHKGHKIKYDKRYSEDILKAVKVKVENDIDREALIEKRIDYICQHNREMNDSELKLLGDIASDDKWFNSHINCRKMIYQAKIDFISEISAHDDLEAHKLASRSAKLLLLKKLLSKLKLKFKNVNYMDNYDKICKSTKKYKLKQIYIDTFRLRGQVYQKKKLSCLEAHKLVLHICSNLMPQYISNKQRKINGTNIRYKNFDFEKGLSEVDTFKKFNKSDYQKNVFIKK